MLWSKVLAKPWSENQPWNNLSWSLSQCFKKCEKKIYYNANQLTVFMSFPLGLVASLTIIVGPFVLVLAVAPCCLWFPKQRRQQDSGQNNYTCAASKRLCACTVLDSIAVVLTRLF